MEGRFDRVRRPAWFGVLIVGLTLVGSSLAAAEVQTLTGVWRLAADPENKGRADRWFEGVRPEAQDAPVPGIIQQAFPGYHGVAWYWHSFRVLSGGAAGDRALIRFGAVDYLADVWLNGKHLGAFEGGETPFEFDVTDSIRADGENLLAVRVLNPTGTPIDGYVLGETPHRNKTVPPMCGCSFNSGGIMYPVEVRWVPPIYITDVFVRPDVKTGDIAVVVTVHNSGTVAAKGNLELALAPAAGGDVLQSVRRQAECAPGLSRHEVTVQVIQPHLWSLDDPFLYRVTASVTTASQRPHQCSVRCGFRDFRIVDGFFHLNGKRIFLKSTHTGNAMPIGQQAGVTADFGRRDMIYAKASGFNMVRFIAGVGYPEQLDLCDELGLMVYEECFASWLLGDSPKMAERFDHSTSAMIRRDRNHPSVTIWGLLNETQDGPVFRQAVGFLPKLRDLDPTRLVLLDSGRWDGQWSIGSASNPGSREWQPVWGVEGPGAASASLGAGGYTPHAGDAHWYPAVPQSLQTDHFIRELGQEDKPVFLSEYGIGSLMDVIDEWRHYEQVGARPDLEDAAMFREQSEGLMADWKRLGFDAVYPFPEDLLRESQRLHARQRTIGFNCIRSNPRLCGYNLTGILDHGMTGEGLWTFWRRWKPATFDAVTDGWSPLRWCLFVEPLHVYSGRDVLIEAVLANEDVLKPGEYPARFRVFGPNGPVWEKETLVKIPDPPVLAAPAIRETIQLDVPAGQYTLAANLERGGSPTGGRLTFYVSDPAVLPRLTGDVAIWGIDGKAEQWLAAHGLRCRPLTAEVSNPREVVLVGKPSDAETNPALWESLTARLTQGAGVVFLSSQVFQNGKAGMNWLPLKNKGRCRSVHDWLYHKLCVANRHPVFDGLPSPGIMDWDYYGPIIPREIFEGQDAPDETIVAGFATGNAQFGRGYGSCLLTAMYKSGEGRLILSTLYILENLDSHPAADRLLLNLIRHAQGRDR
ncbi:MAG: sugar-binding domain-containing protein [Phycisphaerales bacterium]